MTKLLVIVLAVQSSLDGGVPFSEPLYADCPARDTDAGVVELPSGALMLSRQQAERNACLMETCETRRLQLEPVARETTWQAWLYGVAISFAVGLVIGFLIPVAWYFAR